MKPTHLYKVILIFHLTGGSAEEELRRSREENSFPRLLAAQPGCLGIDLVQLTGEKTMSVQTWESEKHWWAALETVKHLQEKTGTGKGRENILVSRDFFGGNVVVHLDPGGKE